jgi:thiol-disulfide isomerase/thioredoxin
MWNRYGLLRYVAVTVFLASSPLFSQEASTSKILIFEGSDWCANCLRLEKEVLADPQFEKFRQQYALVIERIDFPQRKTLDSKVRAYNEKMAERYAFEGIFPTVLLIDDRGSLIAPIPYHRQDVFEFIELLREKLPQ